ncbi:MAG: SDR family oxidoreductase [Nitrospiria bacterium]
MKHSRTFIVTGASSGIGLETTKQLLAQGNVVIGLARNPERAQIDDPHFIPFEIDLSSLTRLSADLADLAREHPQVSGLVACAGQGRFGGIESFSLEQIRGLVDLNFTSQAALVNAFLPSLKKSRAGDIIFIGSEAALSGGKQGAAYSAAKFALRGFAQSLRQECAKSSIRVTLINPGMVETPFFDDLSFRPGAGDENHIEAGDVAKAVLFVLNMRRGTVIDEINLSPLKKVIEKNPKARSAKDAFE